MKNSIYFLIISFLFSTTLLSQEKKGILVMAHGGSLVWEDQVLKAVAPLKDSFCVEVAFGMADPSSMQEAINKLEYQGVTTTVVVPLFISSHSPILRQTEFLLGLRNELADEPMIMNHGDSGNTSNQSHDHNTTSTSYTGEEETVATLDPLVFKSKMILTNCLDADSLVAATLYQNLKQFSKNPEKETLLLVAHGPNEDADNDLWLRNLDSLTKQIIRFQQAENKASFKSVQFTTVRDDANRKVYKDAREKIRGIVELGDKEGDCIVLPLVLAMGGIEKGILKRLEGLHYTWVDLSLLPNENITKFIEQAVLRTSIIPVITN